MESILTYWFDDIGEGIPGPEQLQCWFAAPAGTDEIISEKFAALHTQAVQGELDHWTETARGRLAAILLIDQFSRNIYRGQPEAFAHDHRALAWCKEGMARGHDQELTLAEQTFFYLPLEHSELLADQDTCVKKYQAMADESDGQVKAYALNLVKYADEHRDIIARFGRFPHRNATLGRESTAEEVAYLADGAETFGQ